MESQELQNLRSSVKSQSQPTSFPKRAGGVFGFLENALPILGGALGAVGGTFLGGPVGTAAGGAGGSALGEALKEKLQGTPISGKEIGIQAGLGAIPGVGSGFKALRAGEGLSGLLRGSLQTSREANAAQLLAEKANKAPLGIPVKFIDTTTTGTGTPDVINKLFRGPNASAELNQATQSLAKQGYKTAQRGKSVRTAETLGKPGTESVYKVTGTRTSIPLTESTTTRGIINPEYPSTRPNISTPLTNSSSIASNKGLAQKIADKGLQMESRAGGFGQGEKVAGSEPLGFFDSQKIAQTLKSEGIPAGAAATRQKAVDQALAQRSKQIDQILTTNNTPLGTLDKHKITGDFLKQVESNPNVDSLMRKRATELVNNFNTQVNDTKGLNDFKKGLSINWNQSPSTKLVADQAAKRTFRGVLKDNLNQTVPGIEDANNSFHNLTEANDFLKQAAHDASNQATQAGGSVVGRALTSDTAEAAKSKIGAAMQKVTPTAKSGPTNFLQAITSPKAVGGAAVKQGLSRAAVASLTQNPSSEQQQTADTSQVQDPLGLFAAPAQSSQAQEGGLDQNQLLALVTADPKHASDYISLYNAMKPSSTNTVKPTAQEVTNAQSGISSLQQLSDLISQNPNLPTQAAIPGQGLPFVGGLVRNAAGTGQYQALADNVLDALSRTRTGAAMSNEEKNFYRTMLPQPGDSPDTIKTKLAQFATAFQTVLNPSSAL